MYFVERREKQMKHLLKFLLFFFLFSIFPLYPQTTKERVKVLYVIDGDTLKVSYRGKRESVRLIGIDTPESRKNRRAKRIAAREGKDLVAIIRQGKQAKQFVKSLVRPGDYVYLEFDIQSRDRYQRLLAYVYLEDGKMLNSEILLAGYGVPYTVPPCVKYAKMFLENYREARYERKGLWK